MGSAEGPYRTRLEVLARGGVIEALLETWAADRCNDSCGPWTRVCGKLRPVRSPWAVLVYETVGGPTVQVRLLEGEQRATDTAGAFVAPGLGPVEILACTSDPALPGLHIVMAALENARVVRYHPGGRCTVHGALGGSARYVKVFADEVDDQYEGRERWAASMSGALSFAVAQPQGWCERSRSSWYGVVSGRGIKSGLLGPTAVELAGQMGASLGELAVAPLHPRRRDDAAAQLARTKRGLARATAASPAFSGELTSVGELLTRAHSRLDPRLLVPVHGAAHLGQWLVDDTGRLGLVDFDRYAWGEPEFDLATIVVDLRELSKVYATDELEAAVLDGYRAVAGELDTERLELYIMHKRVAKLVRTACSLRPDAEELVTPLLDAIHSPLARLAAR